MGLLLALDNTNVNQLKEQDFAALHICVTHKYLDGVRLLITNVSESHYLLLEPPKQISTFFQINYGISVPVACMAACLH